MDQFLMLLYLLGMWHPVDVDKTHDATFDTAYCIMLAVGVPCDCPGIRYAHARFLEREQLAGFDGEFWWLESSERLVFPRMLFFEAQSLPRIEEAIPFGLQTAEYRNWLAQLRGPLQEWHEAGYATRYLAVCDEIETHDLLFAFQSQQHGLYQRRLAGASLREKIGTENFMRGWLCRQH